MTAENRRRSAIIDWVERHVPAFNDVELMPWQRQILLDMYRYQYLSATHGKPVKKEPRRPYRGHGYPTLTILDEAVDYSYVLVRPGQRVKEPVDYYKSWTWQRNVEELRRFLKNW